MSLADKLHNARAIRLDYRTHGESLWSRFEPGESEPVRWYYRALCDAFEDRSADLGPGAAPALSELRRVVHELDRLATIGAAPALDQRWIEDVLPHLDDEQARGIFGGLQGAGRRASAVWRGPVDQPVPV